MAKQRQSKSDQAFKLIRKSIQEGAFKPGERLTEAKVIKKIGLSRMPVREALQKMEALGLLNGRGPYGGKFVEYIEDLEPEEVLYRYELREILEGQAARLAARNMTGWQIEELKKRAVNLNEEYKATDYKGWENVAITIHEYIVANCDNPLFFKVWQTFHLMPFLTHSKKLKERILGNIFDEKKHDEKLRMAVEAISSHDPELAEKNMREYIREITDAIRSTLL